MKKMMRLAMMSVAVVAPGLTSVALLASSTAHAEVGQSYFVSCSGRDSANGASETQAWRSLARASKATLAPGDRLLLERNCVWNGERLDAAWRGTVEAPITIAAYGAGAAPVIKNGQNANVKITGQHLVIDGLTSDFDPRNLVACGQTIDEIYGFNFTGGASHNVLRNSTSRRATAGVKLSKNSSSNRVLGNLLENNGVLKTWGADPSLDLGAWGVLIGSDSNEVAFNQFRNNKAACQNQGFKLMSNSVELFEGRNNFIHHNHSEGDRVFSELGSSDTKVADGNRYEFNVFITDLATSRFITTRGSDDPFGPVLNTKVYNNTTYQTGVGSEAIICGGDCGSHVLDVVDNILWAESKVIYADGAIGLGPNVVWNSNGAPFNQFGGHQPVGLSLLIPANPRFQNAAAGDVRLGSDSPARNASLGSGRRSTTDFVGGGMPLAPGQDVGAYRFGASAPPFTETPIMPPGTPIATGETSAFVAAGTPERLLDTRTTAKPAPGSTTVLEVLGHGGVPSSGVTAVVLNVTATEATAPGFVTAWGGGERPEASSLNLDRTDQTRSNLVTIPVGVDGAVRLFTQSGTHLVADVFGWFVPAEHSAAGRFQSLTPARLLDTRPESVIASDGSTPAAGSTVSVQVVGREGVPASGVSAVALNVTATESRQGGFVTVWGSGDQPATSNLNVESAGQTIANQVVVPVGPDGTVRLFTQRQAHLLVDVTGWYTDDTAVTSSSGLFVPVSPYRVLDTRSAGRPLPGATVTLLAAAPGTAAAGRGGLTMNVTATEAAGGGFLTVWPGASRPVVSSLNVTTAGQTIANQVIMPTGADGGVRLFTQTGLHMVVDVTGWYV